MRGADTTYIRGWTWRTRYSTYLGGLGTGIGEGNEGVECGRGASCLAAKEVEKEIDCDAEELAALKRDFDTVGQDEGGEGGGGGGGGQARSWAGTSYFLQEIEGIGGVVKKKVKKRVRVGATVKEHEDERDHGDYLGREQKGEARSWCSWCQRVVPGKEDVETSEGESSDEEVSSSSSKAASRYT